MVSAGGNGYLICLRLVVLCESSLFHSFVKAADGVVAEFLHHLCAFFALSHRSKQVSTLPWVPITEGKEAIR